MSGSAKERVSQKNNFAEDFRPSKSCKRDRNASENITNYAFAFIVA